MKWMGRILGRQKLYGELSEEMRGHLEEKVEALMVGGMPRAEAEYAARREFGNVTLVEEDGREPWRWPSMESWVADVRFGARTLRKARGFAVVAVITLALGIGATTVIFSIIQAVLLKPLAIQDPASVILVRETWQDGHSSMSVGNFADVRRQSASFSGMCALNDASFNLINGDTPFRVQGEMATSECFATFGVAPIAGRTFSAAEGQPGGAAVVLLSERLWRTRFGGAGDIVGRALRINGVPRVVVGVMPKSFDPLLSGSEMWLPQGFSAKQLTDHDNHYLTVVARLKPGMSVQQAQPELTMIAQRLQQDFPLDDRDRGLDVTPLTQMLLGDQRVVLQLMFAAVALVLLIACANIANLQLARARTRRKEMSLRAALGASRRRLVRQLLVENVIVGLAGGVVGILLAYWGLAWIVAHGPAQMPRLDESRIDEWALLFACGVAVTCSLLFGLVPAARAASSSLNEVFKLHAGVQGGSRDRVRSALVIGEVALALILMAGAGLLIRSALLVDRVDPGFDTANLTVGRIGLPDVEYHDPMVARQAFERIVRGTSELPGVVSAGVVSRAPLAGEGNTNGLIAEGRPIDPSSVVNSRLQVVSPEYLATVRIPLLAGRGFTAEDTRERTMVTIVNETLARTMWPGQSAIGKRFACCEFGPKGRMDPVWHEVVGVVADVRAFGLDRTVQPEFYLPIAQMPADAWDWVGRTMDLAVRGRSESAAGAPGTVGAIGRELQVVVASAAPGVPIYQLSTMQQKIAGTLERSHFDTFLLSIFAAAALLLSAVGIYGVLSYMVTQRTRDIGIRMALGATRGKVVGDVLWHGARLTGAGLLLGVVGALASVRLLSSMLYGVRSTDGVAFGGACLALILAALLASYLPALRATRVDPMVALREE
jgi:putative ABC transport system permease protein